MVEIEDIVNRHSKTLGITRTEFIEAVRSILNSNNCDEELSNFLGLDNFDDMVAILKNRSYFVDKKSSLKAFKNLNYEKKDNYNDNNLLYADEKEICFDNEDEIKVGLSRKNENQNEKDNTEFKQISKFQKGYIKNDIKKNFSNCSYEKINTNKISIKQCGRINKRNENSAIINNINLGHKMEKNNKTIDEEELSRKNKKFDSIKTVDKPFYTEITLPSPHSLNENNTLLPIKDNIDASHRRNFSSYTYFNAVQSVVFETAYLTNKNFLVCAPTGCGKTDVAFLTILRELKEREACDPSEEKRKIVFVVPMKALATEIVAKLEKRLNGCRNDPEERNITSFKGMTEKKNSYNKQRNKEKLNIDDSALKFADNGLIKSKKDDTDKITKKIEDLQIYQTKKNYHRIKKEMVSMKSDLILQGTNLDEGNTFNDEIGFRNNSNINKSSNTKDENIIDSYNKYIICNKKIGNELNKESCCYYSESDENLKGYDIGKRIFEDKNQGNENLFKKIEILEYTGDTEVPLSILRKADILVCTPEKLDITTRRLSNALKISLLIIDEIHLLRDTERGHVIESIVSRMFRYIEIYQKRIRIVGLSATLPNYNDVGLFIRAERVFSFGPEYRPVKLEVNIIGIKNKNDEIGCVIDNYQNEIDFNDVEKDKSFILSDFLSRNNQNLEEIIELEKKNKFSFYKGRKKNFKTKTFNELDNNIKNSNKGGNIIERQNNINYMSSDNFNDLDKADITSSSCNNSFTSLEENNFESEISQHGKSKWSGTTKKNIIKDSKNSIVKKNKSMNQKSEKILPTWKKTENIMRDVIEEKLRPILFENHQALIFVTSRKETQSLATYLKSKFPNFIFDIHHAGLPRFERLKNENNFRKKLINVLVSTTTLAWGVNLPARCVFIKGTSFFNPEKCKIEQMGILDILQMFGRAGRPQFDKLGIAYLITEKKNIDHYLGLIKNNTMIESMLLGKVVDVLNSEIYLGTISNLDEAIKWIKGTFLFVRMCRVPHVYGFSKEEIEKGMVNKVIEEYIVLGIRRLVECGLIEIKKNQDYYDNSNDFFYEESNCSYNEGVSNKNLVYELAVNNSTNQYADYEMRYQTTTIGRIASHCYLSHETIKIWYEKIDYLYNEESVLDLLFESAEFKDIILREDEVETVVSLINDLRKGNFNKKISTDYENKTEKMSYDEINKMYYKQKINNNVSNIKENYFKNIMKDLNYSGCEKEKIDKTNKVNVSIKKMGKIENKDSNNHYSTTKKDKHKKDRRDEKMTIITNPNSIGNIDDKKCENSVSENFNVNNEALSKDGYQYVIKKPIHTNLRNKSNFLDDKNLENIEFEPGDLSDENTEPIMDYYNESEINSIEKMKLLYYSHKYNIPLFKFSLTCDQTFVIKNMERVVSAFKEFIEHINNMKILEIVLKIEKTVKKINIDRCIKEIIYFSKLGDYAMFHFFEQNKIENYSSKNKKDKVNLKKKWESHDEIIYFEKEPVCMITKNMIKAVKVKNIESMLCKNASLIDLNLSHNEIFKRYGIHSCMETQWTIGSLKKDCKHFKILYNMQEIKDIYEKRQNIKSIKDLKNENCCYFKNEHDSKMHFSANANKNENFNEKNYNFYIVTDDYNLIDKYNYTLPLSELNENMMVGLYLTIKRRIKFIIVDNVNWAEKQKIMTNKILINHLNKSNCNALIITQTIDEAMNTRSDLNTLISLKDYSGSSLFAVKIWDSGNYLQNGLYVTSFNHALVNSDKISDDFIIIFKGISSSFVYDICEIIKISSTRNTFIYETKNLIDFYKYVFM